MLGTSINPDDFKEGEGDDRLLVKFFLKSMQDQTASKESGRAVFKEVEYVSIAVPGSRDALAVRPATHADKQRFHRHYQAFQQRTEVAELGTPLSEWPAITRSQVEELAYVNIKTVESLSKVDDNRVGNIMGGQTLKAKAQAFLDDIDEVAVLREQNQELTEQLASLSERLEQLEAKPAKKPAKKKEAEGFQ